MNDMNESELKEQAIKKFVNLQRIKTSQDKDKEIIKGLIDMIPEKDIETIYKVYPEVEPEAGKIQAILETKADESPTILHEAINWD